MVTNIKEADKLMFAGLGMETANRPVEAFTSQTHRFLGEHFAGAGGGDATITIRPERFTDHVRSRGVTLNDPDDDRLKRMVHFNELGRKEHHGDLTANEKAEKDRLAIQVLADLGLEKRQNGVIALKPS